MKMIVQGIAVEYRDEGAGPVMLMLHGWKDSLHTFDPLVRELATRFRVVRIDMPGFGESEMPDPSWKLDDYVDLVHACIEKLGIDVTVLVGHSFGGRVIIKGLARRLFHPRTVVLIASAGVGERQVGKNAMLKMVAKAGKVATVALPHGVRQKLRRRLYEKIGSDYHASGRLKDVFLNVVGEDLSADAQQVSVPTLLVWGSEDRSTPLSDGVKLSMLIPNARLETISGASHFVHQEHPQKVAHLIMDFV